MSKSKVTCALVLMGGGARSAYEVGVLKGLREVLTEAGYGADEETFFKIFCGTSAGAMNATLLACYADQPDEGVRKLAGLWRGLGAKKIFHTDTLRALRNSVHWFAWTLASWVTRRARQAWISAPRSLLDNAPLRQLLETHLPLWRLDALCQKHQLSALALSAYSYSLAQHYLFFQGEHSAWQNSHQEIVKCDVTIEHLMASAAIPLVFPSTPLSVNGVVQYFGDGALAQRAPLSAAIHLGGQFMVVVSSGEATMSEPRDKNHSPPQFAEIGGQILGGMFGHSLLIDIAFAQKINDLLDKLGASKEADLQRVELLMFSPSRSVNALVSDYVSELPRALQVLLAILGVKSERLSGQHSGAQQGSLASYLLFHPHFIDRLIALGASDVRAKKGEVIAFFQKLKVEKDGVSR